MNNAAFQEVSSEQSEGVSKNVELTNSAVLIGLPNYRYVMSLLKASLQLAKKEDKVLLVLYLSLNDLKQVNDIHGRTIGDEILTIIAERLERAMQKGDHSLYLGGNKYLIYLMTEKNNLNEAEKVIKELTLIVSKPINIDGFKLKTNVSLGVAAFPMHGNKAGVLLNIAEMKKRSI